jgi:hypothetical protein
VDECPTKCPQPKSHKYLANRQNESEKNSHYRITLKNILFEGWRKMKMAVLTTDFETLTGSSTFSLFFLFLWQPWQK